MTDLKTIPVLVSGEMNPPTLEILKGLFDISYVPDGAIDGLDDAERSAIKGVALRGGLTAAKMHLLPNLEIVASFGVGYDGVDAVHAAGHGIAVTNTPDVLSDEVADTAVALLLNTVRELPKAEAYLRAGQWAAKGDYPLTRTTLRNRSIGIMGLGRVGLAVAKRLEGFGVSIAYHNRSRRDDVAYAYHPTLEGLAAAVDTLVIVAPGGSSTDKAVNMAVLRALGPDGVLINVGRGTVVDEDALIAALKDGTIRAAGLDVFAREPHVPQGLLDAENAVLLPHVGSGSAHTRNAMGDLLVENLTAWFEGREPPTLVPEAVNAGISQRR
jgi:lactate dehydrogenase-like 2-hydroxyacid dehydrogenase